MPSTGARRHTTHTKRGRVRVFSHKAPARTDSLPTNGDSCSILKTTTGRLPGKSLRLLITTGSFTHRAPTRMLLYSLCITAARYLCDGAGENGISPSLRESPTGPHPTKRPPVDEPCGQGVLRIDYRPNVCCFWSSL